jgi:hypothetical protein
MITVTLVGPDGRRSEVTTSDDATARDIATAEYGLFCRILKRNGDTIPLTARVKDGDVVSVEELPIEA